MGKDKGGEGRVEEVRGAYEERGCKGRGERTKERKGEGEEEHFRAFPQFQICHYTTAASTITHNNKYYYCYYHSCCSALCCYTKMGGVSNIIL